MAVIGFDDIEHGRYSTPTLSTISPDKGEIARLAVALLHRRVDAGSAEPAEALAAFTLHGRYSTLGVIGSVSGRTRR